jgi:transposase
VSAGPDEIAVAAPRGGGRRRSWSRAEKSRIVDEAFRPGASAADVARSYGLNANQVFNWRRALAAPAKTKGRGAAPKASAKALTAPSNGFLPVGITVPTSDDGLAPVSVAGSGQLDQRATRYPTPGERTGLIEIDLICGTRLRVDAFVDEHALQRVLSAVKASS